MSESKEKAKPDAGKPAESTNKVLSKSAVNVEKKVTEQKQTAKDAPKPAAKPAPQKVAAETKTASVTTETSETGGVKGIQNQGLSSADAATEAVKVVEDKPQNIAQADINMDFVGAMVRGHGMGVDDEARKALTRENYAMQTETPKLETVTNTTVEKEIKEVDKAAPDASENKDADGNLVPYNQS